MFWLVFEWFLSAVKQWHVDPQAKQGFTSLVCCKASMVVLLYPRAGPEELCNQVHAVTCVAFPAESVLHAPAVSHAVDRLMPEFESMLTRQ